MGIVHLWSNTPCLCPSLKYDHKYILLGQEDTENHQLVFDHKTFVVRKTAFWKRLFLQWKRKLRQAKRLKHFMMATRQIRYTHKQVKDNSRKL